MDEFKDTSKITEQLNDLLALNERLCKLEKACQEIHEMLDKQVLTTDGVARLCGCSRSTLYTSRRYLLPLSYNRGQRLWTRKEVMDHLNRPIEEIKADYDRYCEEERQKYTPAR